MVKSEIMSSRSVKQLEKQEYLWNGYSQATYPVLPVSLSSFTSCSPSYNATYSMIHTPSTMANASPGVSTMCISSNAITATVYANNATLTQPLCKPRSRNADPNAYLHPNPVALPTTNQSNLAILTDVACNLHTPLNFHPRARHGHPNDISVVAKPQSKYHTHHQTMTKTTGYPDSRHHRTSNWLLHLDRPATCHLHDVRSSTSLNGKKPFESTPTKRPERHSEHGRSRSSVSKSNRRISMHGHGHGHGDMEGGSHLNGNRRSIVVDENGYPTTDSAKEAQVDEDKGDNEYSIDDDDEKDADADADGNDAVMKDVCLPFPLTHSQSPSYPVSSHDQSDHILSTSSVNKPGEGYLRHGFRTDSVVHRQGHHHVEHRPRPAPPNHSHSPSPSPLYISQEANANGMMPEEVANQAAVLLDGEGVAESSPVASLDRPQFEQEHLTPFSSQPHWENIPHRHNKRKQNHHQIDSGKSLSKSHIPTKPHHPEEGQRQQLEKEEVVVEKETPEEENNEDDECGSQEEQTDSSNYRRPSSLSEAADPQHLSSRSDLPYRKLNSFSREQSHGTVSGRTSDRSLSNSSSSSYSSTTSSSSLSGRARLHLRPQLSHPYPLPLSHQRSLPLAKKDSVGNSALESGSIYPRHRTPIYAHQLEPNQSHRIFRKTVFEKDADFSVSSDARAFDESANNEPFPLVTSSATAASTTSHIKSHSHLYPPSFIPSLPPVPHHLQHHLYQNHHRHRCHPHSHHPHQDRLPHRTRIGGSRTSSSSHSNRPASDSHLPCDPYELRFLHHPNYSSNHQNHSCKSCPNPDTVSEPLRIHSVQHQIPTTDTTRLNSYSSSKKLIPRKVAALPPTDMVMDAPTFDSWDTNPGKVGHSINSNPNCLLNHKKNPKPIEDMVQHVNQAPISSAATLEDDGTATTSFASLPQSLTVPDISNSFEFEQPNYVDDFDYQPSSKKNTFFPSSERLSDGSVYHHQYQQEQQHQMHHPVPEVLNGRSKYAAYDPHNAPLYYTDPSSRAIHTPGTIPPRLAYSDMPDHARSRTNGYSSENGEIIPPLQLSAFHPHSQDDELYTGSTYKHPHRSPFSHFNTSLNANKTTFVHSKAIEEPYPHLSTLPLDQGKNHALPHHTTSEIPSSSPSYDGLPNNVVPAKPSSAGSVVSSSTEGTRFTSLMSLLESQEKLISPSCIRQSLYPMLTDRDSFFEQTMFAIANICEGKLYRAKSLTLEDYFKHEWSVSRAQVYRFLSCARVLKELQYFSVRPTKERICRAVRNLTSSRSELRHLWAAILEKYGDDCGELSAKAVSDIWMEVKSKLPIPEKNGSQSTSDKLTDNEQENQEEIEAKNKRKDNLVSDEEYELNYQDHSGKRKSTQNDGYERTMHQSGKKNRPWNGMEDEGSAEPALKRRRKHDFSDADADESHQDRNFQSTSETKDAEGGSYRKTRNPASESPLLPMSPHGSLSPPSLDYHRMTPTLEEIKGYLKYTVKMIQYLSHVGYVLEPYVNGQWIVDCETWRYVKIEEENSSSRNDRGTPVNQSNFEKEDARQDQSDPTSAEETQVPTDGSSSTNEGAQDSGISVANSSSSNGSSDGTTSGNNSDDSAPPPSTQTQSKT